MGMWIGRNRKARVTYGFDEIALVPGEVTINPNEVDTSFKIPRKDGSAIELKIPIIASAMDGVTDVRFCIAMGKLGGLGRDQSGRRANPIRQSRRGPRPDRQGRQGGSHRPHPESLYRTDQGGIDRQARAGIEEPPACWPPSVPFRKRRSASAASRRRRGPTFSWCNPPFQQSNIFRPNTNRSSWPIFAGR